MENLDKTILARAAWSRLCEPGDKVAVALLSFLEPDIALQLFLAEKLEDVRVLRGVLQTLESYGYQAKKNVLNLALSRWNVRRKQLAVMRDLATVKRFGGEVLVPEDSRWPVLLQDLGLEAPICLWVCGNTQLLASSERSLAIVGARASSVYGENVCADIVSFLVESKVAIFSGGAYGIDGVAHRSALHNKGVTVAVLAGGVDRYYPLGNENLLREVKSKGALVSELPPGCSPTKWRFLKRNRIIAALTKGTVVVEAAWRSGAINTAGHAARLLRPVGVVPGQVDSPSSAGCHRLLREGVAVCVTEGAECLDLLAVSGNKVAKKFVERDHDGLSAVDLRLFDALAPRKWNCVNELAAISGLSVKQVLAGLGRLDMLNLLQEQAGFWRKK